ncbi:MAG: hypothetical protein HY708_05485, partial [Ignavibacteriae bacterium]|nr:hypothetical protein [Ignavibacteriota bacterium]
STSVKNSITGVTIPIDGIVFLGNQEGTNNQFTVTGEVLYNLTQLSGNYEISLSTSASLKPLSGSQSVLTVQGQSTEYLVVTGDERIAFQKGYEVEGEDGDRLMFSIDFSFADEKLTLDGISLTSVN